MANKQELAPGGIAARDLIQNLKADQSELADVIPDQCIDCPSAWNEAAHLRALKLGDCPGHEQQVFESKQIIDGEEVVRSYLVGRCRMGTGAPVV
jgi:hypothetical protein